MAKYPARFCPSLSWARLLSKSYIFASYSSKSPTVTVVMICFSSRFLSMRPNSEWHRRRQIPASGTMPPSALSGLRLHSSGPIMVYVLPDPV